MPDLHALCHMMHDILNLNDQSIWEYVLEDDNFFDIVSILECECTSDYFAHTRIVADFTLPFQTTPTSRQ